MKGADAPTVVPDEELSKFHTAERVSSELDRTVDISPLRNAPSQPGPDRSLIVVATEEGSLGLLSLRSIETVTAPKDYILTIEDDDRFPGIRTVNPLRP